MATTHDPRSSLYRGMVVAVGGPPHSGKSVFLAELYRQLLARKPSGFAFLQRACPDGEGMWSAESEPDLVQEIRRKGKFDAKFMAFTLPSVEGLGKQFPLVLVDLGGVRSAENAEILRRSTHLAVVSSKTDEVKSWVEFAGVEGCKPLLLLNSRLGDGQSSVELTSIPATGEMVALDRKGPTEPYKEAISQIADWLISLLEEENR